jgi:hypothetical protein
MSTRLTALNLDSLDGAVASVVHQSRSRALAHGQMKSRLYPLGGALGALLVTPFVVLALSALVCMFLSKLIIELVVTVFER